MVGGACWSDRLWSSKLPRLLLYNLGLGLPPPLSVGALMVIFRDSLPSAVFSTTTSRDKTSSSAVIVRFSPMTTFLPLAISACSGQIHTLEFCKSMVLTKKEFLSTCISLRLNRPSLMGDWTCRRNENIVIISSMRKRIVLPAVSLPFQLV
jgi:hypothetical protein